MVLKQTVWSPDTCSCVIGLIWDDTVLLASRTHTAKVVAVGPEHSSLPIVSSIVVENVNLPAVATDVASAVVGENQRKNLILGEIGSILGDPQAIGSILAKGAVTASYTGSGGTRVLNLSVGTVLPTALQQMALANYATIIGGPNVIVISSGTLGTVVATV